MVTGFARADRPDIAAALAHFGARDFPDHSIHPYAPVFPAIAQGHAVVVKQTRADAPQAVPDWTRTLRADGFPVVTPVALGVANPVVLAPSRAWVAYPWITGRPYRPDESDVSAAGDLLGRLHARPPTGRGLPLMRWPARAGHPARGRVPARLLARLDDLASRFEGELMPAIRDAELPVADLTMDWKAVNLVYASGGPVLVDPDNGERAPRLLDLALAALLFHTETAIRRAFAAREWAWFRDAYCAHVRLTDTEVRLWPTALSYQAFDEVGWALGEQNQPDPARVGFLAAALCADAQQFPL